MKKIKLLLILILFIGCTYLMSCSSEPFDYIRVGMTYEKVCYYLGEPDDEELLGVKDEYTLKAYYWFEGASSIEEAKTNTFDKEIPVSYIYIVFSSKDNVNWKIRKVPSEDGSFEKENVINKGIWGIS